MALNTLNFWEIAIDATQIGLCAFILLFLIRNHVKFKRLNSNASSGQELQKFNSEFVVEAVRQQTELAFNHILETIDKERQTLDAYFELRETQLAPGLLKSLPSSRIDPIPSSIVSVPRTLRVEYARSRFKSVCLNASTAAMNIVSNPAMPIVSCQRTVPPRAWFNLAIK